MPQGNWIRKTNGSFINIKDFLFLGVNEYPDRGYYVYYTDQSFSDFPFDNMFYSTKEEAQKHLDWLMNQ